MAPEPPILPTGRKVEREAGGGAELREMRKVLLFLALVAIPVLAAGASIDGGRGVGDIRLGDSYEKVEQALGQADRKQVSPTDPDAGMLFYDRHGLAVLVNKDLKVLGITVTGGGYATPEAIRVGSTRAQVESAYGRGLTRGQGNLSYPGRGLAFSFQNGKVSHVFVVKPEEDRPLLGDRLIVPGQRMGELRLGQDVAAVRSAWGKPDSEKPIREGSATSILTYKEEGVRLVVSGGRIDGVLATTGDFITAGGLKAGATKAEVERAFGKGYATQGPGLFYRNLGIGFIMGEDKVLEIQVIHPK